MTDRKFNRMRRSITAFRQPSSQIETPTEYGKDAETAKRKVEELGGR